MKIFLLSSFFLSSNWVYAEKADSKLIPTQCLSSQDVALQQAMRKLWTDHVVWTRLYILSAISKSADTPVVTARLLKNQDDIGAALIPYYGKDAAATLTQLLKEHILIAAALVEAVLTNSKDEIKKTDQKWHHNVTAIADFLSKANPYWSRQDLLNMLDHHLALTAQEVTCRVEKKWEQDVSTFDQILNQALMMADTLSAGISDQFLKTK